MQRIRDKWEDILVKVREETNTTDISFNTWLKPLEPAMLDGDVLTISIDNDNKMALDYTSKKYALFFMVAIAELTGIQCEVTFLLKNDLPSSKSIANNNNNEEIDYRELNLNPNYTFDTFVVGNNNKMAQAASLAVAESPGKEYNPLLLYGGVGLGKTHLMQSIAHFIKQQNPASVIRYVSAETFTNELIESIRTGNQNAQTKFREKYRNVDVLLIDDIQFIIGKESTQEEFFHTFNVLHQQRKQIILSSDRPPKDMELLVDRIRSRIEMGLQVDIGAPDYETRMAILKRKEDADGIKLDNDILDYIATNVTSNIRELEGALNKLKAFMKLENKEIDLETAKKELQNVVTPDKPKEITPDYIIDVVCEHYHIKKEDIKSKKRSADIAYPRQIAMYLCREYTDATLVTIGDYMGGKDHSTVNHGIKKVVEDINNNEEIRNTVNTIIKKINP